MSRQDNQIWQVTTETSSGQLQAYRSQKIGDAVQMNGPENRGILAIWMTLQLLAGQLQNETDETRVEALKHQLNRFMPGARRPGKTKLVFDVWALITSFAIGDNNPDIFLPLNTVGNHALCLKDRPITRGFFPIVFHPDVLVQAVMHGDETMVRYILNKTNPNLITDVGEGIDFSGRQFSSYTALQAAIARQDFAPNKNSTGLCELLVEALKHQRPDDWYQIAYDQILALYTENLRFYAKKQADIIHDLYRRDADTGIIKAEEKHLEAYERALHSKDLKTIINAHTNAQKDDVISVDQALIDAVENATDEEIQAVLDNPDIDSPLSTLIEQFREEVDIICQSEIISNPQHLLKLLTLYDAFCTRVMNADPNCQKRELFWCHLVGYMQRYLPAGDAQIFANPGLFDSRFENADRNARSFDFKQGGSSIFPLSFDSNFGLGFEFAASCDAKNAYVGYCADPSYFEGLILSKNSKLSELVTQLVRARTHKSCIIS